MRAKIACLIGALLVALQAAAAPPRTLNYQGFLTSSAGTPTNTPVQMTFALYLLPTGGLPIWSETQPSVTVTKGEFSTILGLITPLTIAFDQPYYIGVAVGADPEMVPRQPLTASAYAFRALSIDAAGSVPGTVITGTIPDATVPGTQITGSITTATLPGSQVSGAITTATIPGAQVTGDLTGVSNIVLPDSTAAVGNVIKNGTVFMHNFGVGSTFLGSGSGNFTLTGLQNTAVGTSSLNAVTSGGSNAALGYQALALDTTGDSNTAIGTQALQFNTTGVNNTAVGTGALLENVSGQSNTAIGASVLSLNTTGSDNVGVGFFALVGNTNAGGNTALGFAALKLQSFSDAAPWNSFNTAVGFQALLNNNPSVDTNGIRNTAVGADSLFVNTTGTDNTAIGAGSLEGNTLGSANVAVGFRAGKQIIGDNNIDIANEGTGPDSGVIRIGTLGTQTAAFLAGVNGVTPAGAPVQVVVDANGQLGTFLSTRTVKENIADMGSASDLLMKLRPVTFRYKNRPGWPLQYGLIAEEVAAIAPDLAARGPDGKIETVYYQDLPPMLLNEYQKQQRVIAEQRARLDAEQARVDALEREVAELKAIVRRTPRD